MSTKMSRRQFLAASAAALGTGAVGMPRLAGAQGKSIVVVSFGGTYQDAQRKCYYAPFAAASGVKVLEDTIPTTAKIKAMVDSKNVQWDVVELTSAVGLARRDEADRPGNDRARDELIETQRLHLGRVEG